EKKGLSPESNELCRALRLSSQLQRGISMGEVLLSRAKSPDQLPPSWEKIRTSILQDLNEVLKEDPEQPGAQLIAGRLHMLPPGNEKIAMKALDLAIKYAAEEPIILAEALKSRAELEKNDQKREALLKQALPLIKDNATIYNAIAAHWISVKRFDKALEAAERAVKIEPGSFEYKRTLALALAGLGRYDEAEKTYRLSQDNMTNPLLTQIEEAQFLASIRKPDKAIAIFTELINKHGITTLYYYRAIIYLSTKNYKKALNDINQCLSKDTQMTEAIQLKAMIYLQQENYEDAIRILETLKNRNPKDMSFVCQLAYAHAKKGDIDQSLKILSEQLSKEKEKDNVELLRCKGDILLMYGRWADTVATYDTILKKDPKDSGILNNYSWLLSTSPDKSVRNGKKSLEFALQAAELTYYAEAHILSTLGAAYAELGQFDTALKWSNKAVEIATREQHDRLDDLKKEAESYKAKKPWREVPEKLRDKTKQDKK
ncbi:MAG: tetratricopeptide repeat protein, partial [Thermoguttaceae bacterium]|nr:tetratricopeptide repeat protein [Thermoguttaceae bacterium]